MGMPQACLLLHAKCPPLLRGKRWLRGGARAGTAARSASALEGLAKAHHPAHKPARQAPAKQKASKQRSGSSPALRKHLLLGKLASPIGAWLVLTWQLEEPLRMAPLLHC